MTRGTHQPLLERASASDRAFLAMDNGQVPEQFAVILALDEARELDLLHVQRLLSERVTAVPRLRQRLVRTAPGCGGPIWADDPDFDIRNHVRELPCRAPGDEDALLETALPEIVAPLPRDRPLWAVRLVTGIEHGRAALVVVLHHTVADGVAGLAVLASLVDEGARRVDVPFPRPVPGSALLARDILATRLRALRDVRRSWRLLRASMAGGGGFHPPRVADSSLSRRTGPRRRITVVRTAHAPLRDAAHRLGATTNDAVLVAVARALHAVLRGRGERLDRVTITVPVSGRDDSDTRALGNMVSPMIVTVRATGSPEAALQEVHTAVGAHKTEASGPPPIALLGWLFRPLAALGGYRWYMNHQHRFHTLVSHLRGPDHPLHFAGCPVTSATPVGVAEGGNVPVYFEVLSYAGTLTVAVVADPDHFNELRVLADHLRDELDGIARSSRDLRPAPEDLTRAARPSAPGPA